MLGTEKRDVKHIAMSIAHIHIFNAALDSLALHDNSSAPSFGGEMKGRALLAIELPAES